MSASIEIEQDYECDDGEIGSRMAVFWARGHGHDPYDFIRSVVEFCLNEGIDIPRIDGDATPVEMWQQNVSVGDGIEYRRHPLTVERRPRSPLFAVTVLDVENRRHGATKCAVRECRNPWNRTPGVAVKVDTDGDYMHADLPLCREHGERLPDPWYRVCLVPVGAVIKLPATS